MQGRRNQAIAQNIYSGNPRFEGIENQLLYGDIEQGIFSGWPSLEAERIDGSAVQHNFEGDETWNK
jgi:hypothetical protein